MNYKKMKKKILIFLFLMLIFSAFSFQPMFVQPANAQSSLLPFGGKVILPPFWCSCTQAWLLTIGPPKGGEFLFFPPFTQKAHFQLPSLGPGFGSWTLGLYSPGGPQCSFYTGEDCSHRLTTGTIFQPIVGTSYASF